MRVPGNCVLAAVGAWIMRPTQVRILFVRNRSRRLHCIWKMGGVRYEFYAPGRSRLPYWRNIVYMGTVRAIGE